MGLGHFLTSQQPGGLSSYLSQLVQPTNVLGQIGKAVSQASGGGWGDALTLMDERKRQSQQDAMQQQLQQAQIDALTAKQNRGQIVSLQNGGVGFADPDTGAFRMLREPDAPAPHKPALQEQNEYIDTLDPKSAAYQRAVRGMQGAQFDPAIMAQKLQDQLLVRQTPTYGNLHPRAPGGLSGSRFGRTHANPLPIQGEADLANVPKGTWVSPHPGVVFQVR